MKKYVDLDIAIGIVQDAISDIEQQNDIAGVWDWAVDALKRESLESCPDKENQTNKEGAFDAHRHSIQRFMAGVGNSGLEIKDKEEKTMRRILAEVEVPDGKYCIDIDGEKCMYGTGDLCTIFIKPLAHEYNGRLPVKCDECMNAGQIRGMVCPIDGDCDG